MERHPTEKLLAETKPVKITDFLSPFQHNGQPYLVQLPGNPYYWVPIFSTEDKLKQSCVELDISDYCIKQITDGRDFLASLSEQNVRVMLDPYAVKSENKTRWTECVME